MKKIFFILIILMAVAGAVYWYIYYLPEKEAEILVKKEGAMGVWCAGNNCFWFDREGVAFEAAPKPEGSLVITVEEIGGKVKIGKSVLEPALWENLEKIISSWMVDGLANHFFIDREKQELTAETIPGYKVFLSLRFDPEINLEAFRQLNLSGINYVDLRVKNRIYYK